MIGDVLNHLALNHLAMQPGHGVDLFGLRDFVWQWPHMWWLAVIVVPGLLWLQRRARQRRAAVMRQLGGQPSRPRSGWLRDGARVVAALGLIAALARPGHDPQRIAMPSGGRDVVFVLDVSLSMLAEDAYPSRLEVAKQGVRDALAQLSGQRVGLVIYAGSATILCPLSHDYDFVRYMLDQAYPQRVDFAGTQMQAAIDKVVDHVLDPERAGVHDLVVISDGEDHQVFDPQAEQSAGAPDTASTSDLAARQHPAAARLAAARAGLLLVGVGDPQHGALIPLDVDSEATASSAGSSADSDDQSSPYLQYQGVPVETTLASESLAALADAVAAATSPDGGRAVRVQYREAGTAPFALGAWYRDFATDLPTGGVGNLPDSSVVYRELGFATVLLALVFVVVSELWWSLQAARGSRLAGPTATAPAALGLLLVGLASWAAPLAAQESAAAAPAASIAAELPLAEAFAETLAMQGNGQWLAASAAYAQLQSRPGLDLAQQAVLHYNQALCEMALAERTQASDPRVALGLAQGAQQRLLAAKRLDPGLSVAALGLDQVWRQIHALELAVAEADDELADLQQRVEAVLNRLRELVANQDQLRTWIPRTTRGRFATEPQQLDQWSPRQAELMAEANAITAEFVAIDQQLRPVADALPDLVSVFVEPIDLMNQAIAAQDLAANNFHADSQWPTARRHVSTAIDYMQRVLILLGGQPNTDDSESDDFEDYDDDDLWDSDDQSAQAQNASMQQRGDAASSASMQPLPTPNYSADDILDAEQESQQFRKRMRSESQVAGVDKTW